MTMSEKECLEQTYDHAVNGYRACCQVSKEIMVVLDGLTDQDGKKVLSAAKSGWISQMKWLDQVMAKQGEP
jgi:hypothetical protein